MKSEIETLSPTRIKLSVEIPFEELQPSLDRHLLGLASKSTSRGSVRAKFPRVLLNSALAGEQS